MDELDPYFCFLGDGGYSAVSSDNLLVPIANPYLGRDGFEAQREAWDDELVKYRAISENIFGRVDPWKCMSTKARCVPATQAQKAIIVFWLENEKWRGGFYDQE